MILQDGGSSVSISNKKVLCNDAENYFSLARVSLLYRAIKCMG